jgi:pimeloyl-ACP methyl ester carboxylesterase
MEEKGTIKSFSFRNLKIFYKKTGGGKPIIFLHNGGNSHIIWNRQLDYFSGSHTCYAFDLPGYGMSVNPDARFPLELYTDFLDEFIAKEKLAPVTLVGNCVGSATSLTYTMKKPENVDKLILFNVLTKRTVWDGMLGIFFKLTAPVPSLRPRLRKWFGHWVVPEFAAPFFISTQFGSRGYRDPEFVNGLKKLYRLKGPLGALTDILMDIESFVPMDKFEIPQTFPQTLVIWGEKNRILPVKSGQQLCAGLKPRKFEIIKGGGHVVMHELHQEVNPLILSHLELKQAGE